MKFVIDILRLTYSLALMRKIITINRYCIGLLIYKINPHVLILFIIIIIYLKVILPDNMVKH